jgi:hypothetical protein
VAYCKSADNLGLLWCVMLAVSPIHQFAQWMQIMQIHQKPVNQQGADEKLQQQDKIENHDSQAVFRRSLRVK